MVIYGEMWFIKITWCKLELKIDAIQWFHIRLVIELFFINETRLF